MKSFRAKLFFIIVSIFIIKAANAGTAFAAIPLYSITSDTTLDPSQTYIIAGKSTIAAGVTLTAPAGTHFVFNPGAFLVVNGSLITKGTASNHVSFFANVDPSPSPAMFAVPNVTTVQSPQSVDPSIVSPVGDIETPEENQTPGVQPLTVSNTVMLSNNFPQADKHDGMSFSKGSKGTMTYTDISDGTLDIFMYDGSTVKIDHSTFSDSDRGIATNGGDLTLTNDSFTNILTPVSWDIGYKDASFIHHDNTFTNTDIKGWVYTDTTDSGIDVTLEAGDGEYEFQGSSIVPGASLTIEPGVTVFVKDGDALDIKGSFTAKGTADKPIIFYGDDVCTVHTPTIQFDNPESVTMQYVSFRHLCNGLQGTSTTTAFSHIDFDTIAGIGFSFSQNSTITANYITMQNIYQAFDVFNNSPLSLTNAIITSVNNKGPAIAVYSNSPLHISDTHMDGAYTCLAVYGDGSLVADKLLLSNCTNTGISSDNPEVSGTTDITLTNSEIGYSGGAMNLVNAVVKKVVNNDFHQDDAGVVLTHMGKTVLINNNWGSDTGPTIDSNPGGTGTRITATDVAEVDYKPWLGAQAAISDRDPIIIVPGITGSVLNKAYDDDSELWPNILKLTVDIKDSFLDDLKLLQDGTPSPVRPVSVGDVIRSAGQSDIFEGLIASLLQHGYKEGVDLFVMPYDWRLSNTQNQALLGTVITHALTTSGKDKVNIVAHSMGGLLAKDYLAQNPTAPVNHLFFIATPHLGTPKVFKALMYGDDMGYSFSLGPAFSVDILNPDRVKAISQNMPAVYELLPSQQYVSKIGSYINDFAKQYVPKSDEQQPQALNFDQSNTFMVQQGRNAKIFPFATTLHSTIDDMDFSNIPTTNFVGCGATKTIGAIALTRKESLSVAGLQLITDHRLSYVQGDGAVPLASAAAAPGASTYYVAAGSHGTMPSVDAVKNAIVSILSGQPIQEDGSIAVPPTHCALQGEVVEVHSPVTLDIYDAEGRHTGPSDSGDIEFGIPNVDYEMIGDEKFAFLPSGATYKVVNHAESAGTYDMYISHSDADDTITDETFFNDVPITADSVGTVSIGSDDHHYVINQDLNGDGVVDSIINPTSVLDQKQASDTVPPVTSASIKDTTVTLTATDDNAGVLNTKYSTDGTTWHTYSAPFMSAIGTTVQYLSMDKAGNVEDIKNIVLSPALTTNSGGGTIIPGGSTTPPNTNNSTDTTNTPDTTDTNKNESDEPLPDQTHTDDTDQPETKETIPTTQSSETKPEEFFTDQPVSTSQENATTQSDSDPGISHTLLASAGGVVLDHENDFLVGGSFFLVVIFIFISKRFFNKKRNNNDQ